MRTTTDHASLRRIGQSGEEIALRYLESHGYRLVARNFTTRRGEVDLIVEQGELLVFVEVRWRASSAFGGAEATVSRPKQRRVVIAAIEYSARHRVVDRALRFDVVAINGAEVLHIPNAFDAGG